MKKIFLKILSVFSFMCMFMFNSNIIGGKKGSGNISIAMATDNNYAYPTIVAMTSILENKNPETKIDFYIMLSGDFDKLLRDKIESLKNKECSISFIDMKDKLKDLYTSGTITTASYYRILLPDLLPDLDKILYMDVDTITLKDLSDLFNIDVDNFYFAGISDKISYGGCGPLSDRKLKDMFIKIFGGKENLDNMYVNAGILLFNLKKMREDKLVKKLIECASANNFNRHDQDVLNYVCHSKIKNIDKIFNCRPAKIENFKDQVIVHYMCKKPWNYHNIKYADIWWNYAKETELEKEITERFPDKSKIKKNIHSRNRSAEKQHKKIKKAA